MSDVARPSARRAAARILEAAAEILVARGAAHMALHEVAEAAGVSKGLIHYHFHDRDTLLARLAEWMTARMIAREAVVLDGAEPTTAVGLLWERLDGELARGHLRALLELEQEHGPYLRDALDASAVARRDASAATVEKLFTLLELVPRVPPALIAETVLAFENGLARRHRGRDREGVPRRAGDEAAGAADGGGARVAFDVFWLAMLGLAE